MRGWRKVLSESADLTLKFGDCVGDLAMIA
jgi:hypothetical protein